MTGDSSGGSIGEQRARSNNNINSIAFHRGSAPLQQFWKRSINLIDVDNINEPISYFSRSSKNKNETKFNKQIIRVGILFKIIFILKY